MLRCAIFLTIYHTPGYCFSVNPIQFCNMEVPTWTVLNKQFTTEMLMNITPLALKELEIEMLEIDIALTKMRERAATYLNGTNAGLLRSKRQFAKLLQGRIAAFLFLHQS